MKKKKEKNKQLRKVNGNFRKFGGIVKKYFMISIRDKPMWFWVLGYPLLFMLIFSFGLKDAGETSFDLAFVSYDSDPISGIQNPGEEVDFGGKFLMYLFSDANTDSNLNETFNSRFDLQETEAKYMVETGDLDAVIIIPQNFSEVLYNTTDDASPSVIIFATPDPTTQAIIANIIEKIIIDMILGQENIDLAEIHLQASREEISYFDYIMPGMLIAGVTIAIMNIAQNMGREKELGLMQRLDTTPVPRRIQLLGNGTAQLIFTSIQIIILMICLIFFGVDIHENASWGLAFLDAFLLGFSCIGLGLIVAALVKDSNAAGGLAWVIILPLQFFGETIAILGRSWFNQIFPTFYATNAIRSILVSGLGLAYVWQDLLINFAFGVVFMSIGVLIFEKKNQV